MLTPDHLVYATPDLGSTVERLGADWGVRPAPGGSHPGWGTRNHLLALGPELYLEVIGPDPGQPEPVRPRPFGIDELTEPKLVTWAVKADSLEARVERAAVAGLHLGPVRSMSREGPDGSLLSWRLTVPEVLPGGGIVPFLIDWQGAPGPARSAPPGCRLLELSGGHPDPDTVERWLDALEVELPLHEADSPGLHASVSTPRGPRTLV